MSFVAFPKIPRLSNIEMTITQKLHGTNACVHIFEGDQDMGGDTRIEIKAQSRTRNVTPEDDNFGFAAWVEKNAAELIEKLGLGYHYGEWVGPGINSGEGLPEKRFVLFDFWKYPEDRPLPPQVMVVPVLYRGPLITTKIDETMTELKTGGSKLVPGFMRPEGIVISIMGNRVKKVFEAEETKWTGAPKVGGLKVEDPDVSHLLQPIRLEKILSRDESYMKEYPKSLPSIAAAYVTDLESEGQMPQDKDELRRIKKALGGVLFLFLKIKIKEWFGRE